MNKKTFNDGLEEAALYHDERRANCLAVAAVNQTNELGADCRLYATNHKIAAEEIRAMKTI